MESDTKAIGEERCWICNGTGNQYLTDPKTEAGTFHSRERADCPRCDGEGYLHTDNE